MKTPKQTPTTKTKTIRGWIGDKVFVTCHKSGTRKVTTLSGDVIDFPIRSRRYSPLTHVTFDRRQFGSLYHTKKDAIAAGWLNPSRVEITVKLL